MPCVRAVGVNETSSCSLGPELKMMSQACLQFRAQGALFPPPTEAQQGTSKCPGLRGRPCGLRSCTSLAAVFEMRLTVSGCFRGRMRSSRSKLMEDPPLRPLRELVPQLAQHLDPHSVQVMSMCPLHCFPSRRGGGGGGGGTCPATSKSNSLA